MLIQAGTNEPRVKRELNIVVQGRKAILRFTDTPNNEIAKLVKRALLDACMPTAGETL